MSCKVSGKCVSGNKSLGQFNLSVFHQRRAGMPQIEVTFDIDSNGILHVHAKDKATGKENKITIQASSGLSDDEVQRMVQDAEAHAEEDKRARELAESRNQGDALVHSTKKSLADYGDKLDADTKGKIEAAHKDLEQALAGNDKAAIDTKISALTTAAQKLGEAMYAASQGQASQPGQEQQAGAASGSGESGPPKDGGDDVVDADFKEVKK